MRIDDNLPSAFLPDMPCQAATHAPSFVSLLTARVLGSLISARVLKLDYQAGETIEFVDRLIAAAIDEAIPEADLTEASNAARARHAAPAVIFDKMSTQELSPVRIDDEGE